jgi:peptidoglycan/LPS O-acetylase OafA/YrhL
LAAQTSSIQFESTAAGSQTASLGYRASLDGLRAVCVLSVISLHSEKFFHIPFPFTERLYVMLGGFFGVDGFFVLSGFLITALLIEEWEIAGEISLRRFYLRRALRLLPALALMAAACAIYAATRADRGEADPIWRGVFGSVAYCANFLAAAGKDLSMLVHTWSLSTEEQFYLVWPLALGWMLRARWSRAAIIAVVVSGICAAALWRAWLFLNGASFARVLYAPETRADALLMGCLLGLLWSWRLLPATPLWRLIFRCLAIVASLYLAFRLMATMADMPQLYLGEFTLVAAAFAVVILELVDRPSKPFAWALENRVMVWLGRVSYGLYLWHPPVIYFWRERGPSYGVNGKAILLAQMITLLAVVAVSFYFVEQPFLRLKRKFGARIKAI